MFDTTTHPRVHPDARRAMVDAWTRYAMAADARLSLIDARISAVRAVFPRVTEAQLQALREAWGQ